MLSDREIHARQLRSRRVTVAPRARAPRLVSLAWLVKCDAARTSTRIYDETSTALRRAHNGNLARTRIRRAL